MLFEDHLDAVDKAHRTITTYRLAVVQLGQFLAERGMPRDPTAVTREHLIEWMRHLQRPVEEGGQGVVAATARQRYRSISAFFKFLVETEEISENPMRKMKPLHAPEQPVPLIGDEEIRRLFKRRIDLRLSGLPRIMRRLTWN